MEGYDRQTWINWTECERKVFIAALLKLRTPHYEYLFPAQRGSQAWYRPSMDQKSLIDLCVALSNLFSDVLEIRWKQDAELSADHHLVLYSL